MLDFCLASGPRPEKAGDVADMSQAERPCSETTGGVEDRFPNRISRKRKERVPERKGEEGKRGLGKQSLGIKMRIVEAILHPLKKNDPIWY